MTLRTEGYRQSMRHSSIGTRVVLVAMLAAVCFIGVSPGGVDVVSARPAGTADVLSRHQVAAGAATNRPLVLAYYYIWYREASWQRAKTDLPALGPYSSSDPSVIAQHVAWAMASGVDGLIVSWKHEARLDEPLELLVDEATASGLKLVLLYQGLDFDRQPLDVAKVEDDLHWFLDTYEASPAFAAFGQPTVIWSGSWGYTDAQIARVRASIGAPERVLLLGSEKSAAAYASRVDLFDGDAYYWSSPDPLTTPRYQRRLDELTAAVRADAGLWIAPAAPGFDARLVGGTNVVPRRDGQTYRAAWQGALNSSPDAIGIISWNEFSENSQIEPSQLYADQYLGLTAQLVSELPGGDPAAPPPTFAPAETVAPRAPVAPSSPTEGGLVALLAGAAAILVLVGVGAAARRRVGE